MSMCLICSKEDDNCTCPLDDEIRGREMSEYTKKGRYTKKVEDLLYALRFRLPYEGALVHCETVKGLCAKIKQLQSDLAEATNELNQQDRGGRERPDGGGGSGIPFYPHERKLGYLITNKEDKL